MNVVRIVHERVRVFEHPRQLTRGELARDLGRYQGNALTLGLASGDGACRRDSERERANIRYSHDVPLSFREDGDGTLPRASKATKIHGLSGEAAAA